MFGLTDKDFVTPLGRVATDRAAVDRLRRAGGGCLAPSDIAHRREHSLEFELIFLQRVLGPAFSLVPVLCGSVSQELARVSRASEIPGVGGVLAAMRSLWEEDRSGTLFVAGVDLSHIGPKFGHRERAVSLLLDARAHDQELLRAFTAGDASAFWAESRRVSDRYNVCGLSALACLLEVFPGATGSLLDYDFWIEEETQSAVSFAAAALGAEGKREKDEEVDDDGLRWRDQKLPRFSAGAPGRAVRRKIILSEGRRRGARGDPGGVDRQGP